MLNYIKKIMSKKTICKDCSRNLQKCTCMDDTIDMKQERMYSEADMREAYFTAIRSTGEGWNGEHAGNGSLSIEKAFSEGYEIFIEQYKNK